MDQSPQRTDKLNNELQQQYNEEDCTWSPQMLEHNKVQYSKAPTSGFIKTDENY